LLSSFRSSLVGLTATFAAASVLFVPALAEADTTPAVAGGTTSTSTATAPATTDATATPSAAAAKKVGTKPLRKGDRGARVKALQTLLTQAGFKTSTDGEFGATTAKVVQRFQRAARLRATGIADTRTLSALKTATDGSAASNTSGGYDVRSSGSGSYHLGDRIPLKKGMSGHDVKILQDYLKRAGFDTSVDGEYGTGTVKSVKQFETDQQVGVDGLVDAADIDLLRSLVDGEAGTAPATPTTPAKLAPGDTATVGPDGLATAPANAPDAVKQIIAAGNAIAKKPYVYGGGHGKWDDRGYDCSGSVSYALHAAGLLDAPLPSGDFTSWGDKGPGQWVTIYANGGHMYMVVAGLRFDTSGRQQDGTRWHDSSRSSSGYTVVHPPGL
jgi:peptidoglycan hydrolase-like protein with peptidoglycan-binding domain